MTDAPAIPSSQQAAIVDNPGPDVQITIRYGIPVGSPGPEEVLIKLTHTGICGSEVRALSGWGSYDRIIGHEGVGTVVRLGSSVAPSMQGKRVGVQWLYSCCHECPTCRRGSSHICPRQGNTGRSCPGTLQQYVVADSRHIFEIPEALSGELAAPLLCAGLTMMGAARDLRAHGLAQGDWVVILGSGGGLGHIGIQIAARVMGLRVIAVDKGSSKRSVSLESGAEVFVDYTESDVAAEVTKHTGEGAAGVMVVSDAEEAFRLSARLARPAGIILCIGLPPDQQEIPVSVGMCIRKALTIKGVLVGSENDMHELFQHAVEGVINPLTEVVGFSEAPESLRKLVKKEIAGRIVVALP